MSDRTSYRRMPEANELNSFFEYDTKTGFLYWKNSGRYKVQIGNGSKKRIVRYFKSFEEAVSERVKLEQDIGYHKNHGRSQ